MIVHDVMKRPAIGHESASGPRGGMEIGGRMHRGRKGAVWLLICCPALSPTLFKAPAKVIYFGGRPSDSSWPILHFMTNGGHFGKLRPIRRPQ